MDITAINKDNTTTEKLKLCVKDSKQVIKFLKLSRTLDDNIRPRINEGGPKHCNEFVKEVIYPNWDNRMGMLDYCLKATSNQKETPPALDMDVAKFQSMTEEERNEMLRIDPYGYKGLIRKQLDYEMQVKGLKWMYERERDVDLVVRQRTSEVLKDICDYEVDQKYVTS